MQTEIVDIQWLHILIGRIYVSISESSSRVNSHGVHIFTKLTSFNEPEQKEALIF